VTAGRNGAVWAAVVPAAGSARRMGFDKTLARVHGVPVLARTIFGLRRSGLERVLVGVRDAARVRAEVLRPFGLDDVALVVGGETRAETVALCLAHLPDATTHVVVHDAARPNCSADLIGRVMAAAEESGAAAAALPVVDSVHRVGGAGCIVETLDRSDLRLAQTPQAFHLPLLLRAHQEVPAGSDDAGMVAALGVPVRLVDGERDNAKLTVPADMPPGDDASTVPFAVGLGHDIHRLVPGRPLVLGGVRIPYECGLLGHSDADVVCHAVADALLGAAGLGDIGRHFPPGDPVYAGADSLVLLARCRAMAEDAGWRPVQADCLVLAERPRLAPYAESMRAALAMAIRIPSGRINVKAGTNEGLGAVGRGEGIAAQAVVLAVPSRAPARPL